MIEMLSIFLVVIPGVLWSYMATPVSPTLLNSPADKLPASPRAKIKNGTLQGVYLPSFHQDAFLGVPFAKPPLGDLRFRHPQTYNNTWKGVNDASARKPSCPAAFGSAAYGVGALDLAEDCLYLDIVRPSDVASGAKLPVMAWIYGGGTSVLNHIIYEIVQFTSLQPASLQCRWQRGSSLQHFLYG